MTYDQWKLSNQYDEGPEEECFHEEYEADINGRATCNYCGQIWYQTDDEIERERELHALMRRWARQIRLRRITFWIRWPLHRLLGRVWPSKACSVLSDDEIPF